MKKVLFTATVDDHILSFHLPYLEYFKMNGYEVHVASNGTSKLPFVDKKYNISFERTPMRLNNLKAFRELKVIIENEDFSLIHCHTPMGGALTRLAAKNKRKKGTRVIYTAHGFHFFKGASLMNWILYYPIEKWLSKFTDCIITINDEDYRRAKNGLHNSKLIKKVNGVGINLGTFAPVSEQQKSIMRQEYNLSENDFVLVYAAELNYNKHQDLLIYAVSLLKDKIPQIKLLLAGEGELEHKYKKLVEELGLESKVFFIGFRKDMDKIFKLSNLALSGSRREGLPVNIMEAMATGLPLVVTNCRGNRDLVKEGINGYLIETDDVARFASAIDILYQSEVKRNEFAKNSKKLVENFELSKVLVEVVKVYEEVLGYPIAKQIQEQYRSTL